MKTGYFDRLLRQVTSTGYFDRFAGILTWPELRLPIAGSAIILKAQNRVLE